MALAAAFPRPCRPPPHLYPSPSWRAISRPMPDEPPETRATWEERGEAASAAAGTLSRTSSPLLYPHTLPARTSLRNGETGGGAAHFAERNERVRIRLQAQTTQP